jgi:hypothetical protein
MQAQTKSQTDVLSDRLNCAIAEDTTVETKLKRRLAEEYAALREGVHVSDLTLCMRQSLFRKLDPRPPTTKQIGYFLDGARRHQALQALYGEGAAEKEGVFEGVRYHIDVFTPTGFVIEFKTTRAKEAISDHWLRQLIYYMLAADSGIGLLQVQRILPRDGDPFPGFIITLDDKQRAEWLSDFRERSSRFLEAMERNDPSRLPVYRGEKDWVCRECPYRKECDRMEGLK